jgi:GT2 family glycosyltransferase
VDNGSTDGSSDYVTNLPSSIYKKIIIKNNMGSAYAHSKGMQLAEGKYVITIDDDCFLMPIVVERTVEIFEAHQNLAGIGYGFLNPNVNFDETAYKSDIEINSEEFDFSDSYESMVATSGAAFRKSALEKIGYYDLNWFYMTEDVELCMNLIAHGYNTVKISKLIAHHKSSPVNRNFDHIAFQGTRGVIWLMFKYYPLSIMLQSLFKFINKSIYYTIINKKLVYLKGIIASLKKINYVVTNRKSIEDSILHKLVKPENSVLR